MGISHHTKNGIENPGVNTTPGFSLCCSKWKYSVTIFIIAYAVLFARCLRHFNVLFYFQKIYFFPLILLITQTAAIITRHATKMPPMPFAIISRAIIKLSIYSISFRLFADFCDLHESGYQVNYDAAGNYRCDLTGYVCACRMHQDNISRLFLSCQLLHNSGGHGECGDSCCTDHGV